MSEPRMWWLRKSASGKGPRWNCTKDLTRYAGYKDIIPVIEYSAYQRLERALAKCKEQREVYAERSKSWTSREEDDAEIEAILKGEG